MVDHGNIIFKLLLFFCYSYGYDFIATIQHIFKRIIN